MSPDLESDPYHDFSPENCSGIAGSSKQTPSHPSTDCALIRWTCLLSVPERRSSRKKGPTARASRRFLDWACVRPAFVKGVGKDSYHPIVLGEMRPEELRASTVSLVCGPYEEHELFIV